MAAYGYGNVNDRGFVGFDAELDEAAWADIKVDGFASAKDDVSILLEAPRPVVWKFRLRWSISKLLQALGMSNLVELDGNWDAAQRRLFHRLAIFIDDKNLAKRSAADRLIPQLLLGNGVAQTKLDFESEVDFGRNQQSLTRSGTPLEKDVIELGIQDVLEEANQATEALAKALGRGTGGRKAPSKQIRDALQECVQSFNAVHDEIAWFVEHTPPGARRDQLNALLSPLDQLLERFPSRPAVAAPAPAVPDQPGSTSGGSVPRDLPPPFIDP